jgi:hypothetical protein
MKAAAFLLGCNLLSIFYALVHVQIRLALANVVGLFCTTTPVSRGFLRISNDLNKEPRS